MNRIEARNYNLCCPVKPDKAGLYKHCSLVLEWHQPGVAMDWVTEETVEECLEKLLATLPKEVVAALAVQCRGDVGKFVVQGVRLIYGPYEFTLARK